MLERTEIGGRFVNFLHEHGFGRQQESEQEEIVFDGHNEYGRRITPLVDRVVFLSQNFPNGHGIPESEITALHRLKQEIVPEPAPLKELDFEEATALDIDPKSASDAQIKYYTELSLHAQSMLRVSRAIERRGGNPAYLRAKMPTPQEEM